MPSHNLLVDPVIRAEIADSREIVGLSLPQVFEAVERGTLLSLPGLLTHQADPVIAFLVNLMVAAKPEVGPAEDATAWRERLRALTPDFIDDEPWYLCVENFALPAFMQAPTPDKLNADDWNRQDYPDDIDILVTSTNHSLKSKRFNDAKPDHWVYALITLQTCAKYLGAGNYGASRMSGGWSSRAFVTIRGGVDLHEIITREAAVLRERLPMILENYPFLKKNGIVLCWLLPWNGEDQIQPHQLSPLFLEVCRRVRITSSAGDKLAAVTTGSKKSRINVGKDDSSLAGRLGCGWGPIDVEKDAVFNPPPAGIGYRLLADLMLQGCGTEGLKFSPSPLQEIGAYDEGRQDLTFHVSAVIGGKGETNGYFERDIPIPHSRIRAFRSGGQRQDMRATARAMIDDASTASRALFNASLSLLQGSPEKLDFDSRETVSWATTATVRFDQTIDACFFTYFWDVLEQGADGRTFWRRTLKDICVEIFDRCAAGLPISPAQRLRSETISRGRLIGSLYSNFDDIRPATDETVAVSDKETVQ